ncbi:MAG TPA: cyclic nucleotide-binding domain-containing protein, partial [Burkholderiaceae bacterium]|nr:cyclic nucleotide-binding domain-containing protein [Burkholderiaceae bacterium]
MSSAVAAAAFPEGSADRSADDRLPRELLDAIAPHGTTRTFATHAILINEGDTTDSLYIVLGGRVKVYA